MPSVEAASQVQAQNTESVPASQANGGHWSAFAAPDLALVFADEPWLGTPGKPEGQSDLLSRLESIQHADVQRALERLGPVLASLALAAGAAEVVVAHLNPKRFLLDVINNDSGVLALRIEAANDSLPYVDDREPP